QALHPADDRPGWRGLRAPAHDLEPPGTPRGEQLVGVDLVGPPDEVALRLLLGAAVDRRPPLVEPRAPVVAPLERGEPLLDSGSFRVPFSHTGSIAGR